MHKLGLFLPITASINLQ